MMYFCLFSGGSASSLRGAGAAQTKKPGDARASAVRPGGPPRQRGAPGKHLKMPPTNIIDGLVLNIIELSQVIIVKVKHRSSNLSVRSSDV